MVKCLECKLNDIEIIYSEDKFIFYCKKCRTKLVSEGDSSVPSYYNAYKKQRKLPLALKNAEDLPQTSLGFRIALAIAQDLQDQEQIAYCEKKINELKEQEDADREEAIKISQRIYAENKIIEAKIKEKQDQEKQEKIQRQLDEQQRRDDEQQELVRKLSEFKEKYQKLEFYGDWLEKRKRSGEAQYLAALGILMTKIYDDIKNCNSNSSLESSSDEKIPLLPKSKPSFVSEDERTIVYPKPNVNQIIPSKLELPNEYRRIRNKLTNIDERLYPKFETLCARISNDEHPRLIDTLKKELLFTISPPLTCEIYYGYGQHKNLFNKSIFSQQILNNKHVDNNASDFLSRIMFDKIQSDYTNLKEVNVLVPVPNMLGKPQIACGVSLALKLSKMLGKPCEQNVLAKIKSFPERKDPKTSDAERERMANESYIISDSTPIKNKSILLVDDVLVGGSTTRKCANLLIDNGARHVKIICAGKSFGYIERYGY